MSFSMGNLVNSYLLRKKVISNNINPTIFFSKMKYLITFSRSFTIYTSVKPSASSLECFEMLFSWITITLYHY